MKHMQTYSTEHQLKELAYNLPFPMRCDEMVIIARYMDCSSPTIQLLRRFDPNDVFENGADFINRCEEVRLLLGEECYAPKEWLCSPQD